MKMLTLFNFLGTRRSGSSLCLSQDPLGGMEKVPPALPLLSPIISFLPQWFCLKWNINGHACVILLCRQHFSAKKLQKSFWQLDFENQRSNHDQVIFYNSHNPKDHHASFFNIRILLTQLWTNSLQRCQTFDDHADTTIRAGVWSPMWLFPLSSLCQSAYFLCTMLALFNRIPVSGCLYTPSSIATMGSFLIPPHHSSLLLSVFPALSPAGRLFSRHIQ